MTQAAIIDDGVNPSQCPGIHAWAVSENRLVADQQPLADSHATICMQIIKQYAIDAEWHSIKILHADTKRGDLCAFLYALDACRALGVRLIHLSMGSRHYGDFKPIESAVKRLTEAGVIMVGALSNHGTVTYPACLPYVIGVKQHPALTGNQYACHPKTFEGIDFFASSEHQLSHQRVPFVTQRANSYAAPVITAKVLRILAENPFSGFDEIYQALQKYAVKNSVTALPLSGEAIKADEQANPPVVAFVGFTSEQIMRVFPQLAHMFEKAEYHCETVVQGFSGVDVIRPNYIRRVCQFFGCGILLVGITQLDYDDKYDFIDVWVINDEYDKSVLNISTDQDIIDVHEPDATVLYRQLITLLCPQ